MTFFVDKIYQADTVKDARALPHLMVSNKRTNLAVMDYRYNHSRVTNSPH